VCFEGTWFAVTAVDGTGLFDPVTRLVTQSEEVRPLAATPSYGVGHPLPARGR
jgi:hypothetical protein